MTGLLEREWELGEFNSAFEGLAAGRGSVVAIEAAAGLGKTRLLQEARKLGADSGLDVLSARATELERDFPFALVRQLFESRLQALSRAQRKQVLEGAAAAEGALGLAPSDDRPHDSFAVLHGLYWVTAALAEQPLLLAIDDAQWADTASLDYISFLLPRLEELPVLLVVTSRSGEPDLSQGLRRIAVDPLARNLTLAPLSPVASSALLAQHLDRDPEPAFAAACHEVSGGNPFLLSELARALLGEGIEPAAGQVDLVRGLAPERVAQMVSTRLERLSTEAVAAAQALAILGDDSAPRLVAALAEVAPGEISWIADELRAGAIFDPGPSLRFVHPLVRNVIYTDLPPGERAAAHDRAAALLRDQGAGPERIGTQLLAGEPRAERASAEMLVEAGERALADGAPRSAIAYLTRALAEPAPPDLRPAVLSALIDATFKAADHDAWAAVEPEVLAELEREPSLRTRWAGQLTAAMALGGRFEEAASLLVKAVEVATAEGDVDRAFQLEAQLSTLARLVPSVPEVDLARHSDRFDPDSPSGRLAAAVEARSAVGSGSAKEAADAAKRALGNNGIIFAEEPELVASVVSVLTLVAADEVAAAQHAAERALAISRAGDDTPGIARGLCLRAAAGWAGGDLVNAEADMRQAVDLVRLAGIQPMVLLLAGVLIEILIERDELEAAERELESLGMASAPISANPMSYLLLFSRGHLRFERGEFEPAVEDLTALSYKKKRLDFGGLNASFAGPLTVRALRAIEEDRRARELVESMSPLARRWGSPSTEAHVLRAQATMGGGNAIGSLEEAAALLRDSPRRLERAHALVDLGSALRRAGRRAAAREPLREAFKLARQLGAARIAKRANEELEASGETVRRYTPIGVESLTPSERRVADLAASGMTNRQIAQSLFVTVKTVEAHLSAAYGKLDIHSRRALPSALVGVPQRS